MFWKELMYLKLISLCRKIRDIEKSKESFSHWMKENEDSCKKINKCLNGLCSNVVNEYIDDIAERIDKNYYVVKKISLAGRYISESLKSGKKFDEVCVKPDRSNSKWIFMDNKNKWNDLEEETTECNSYME